MMTRRQRGRGKSHDHYTARTAKNIQSVMYYELDSGDETFGLVIDGDILSRPYDAFTSFIAGHPKTS